MSFYYATASREGSLWPRSVAELKAGGMPCHPHRAVRPPSRWAGAGFCHDPFEVGRSAARPRSSRVLAAFLSCGAGRQELPHQIGCVVYLRRCHCAQHL